MKKHILRTLVALSILGLATPAGLHLAFAQADTTTPPVAAPVADAPAKQSLTDNIMGKIRALFSAPLHAPVTDEDKAVQLARDGQDEEALTILSRLYQKDKSNQTIGRDYTAILGWAGHDQEAVDVYQTLPVQEPDYVLASVGHSYRKLGLYDKALAVYRQGLKQYPKNVLFAEGSIRILADSGDLDSALLNANDDLSKNGERPEVVAAKNDIILAMVKRDDEKAVDLGRNKQYPEALAILSDLHEKHSDNLTVTRDYLAVSGWAEGHDEQVVGLYKTLPDGDEPDYVWEAVGHAYRNLHQSDMAFDVYQLGLKKYPDNVIFAEGSIRSLADQKKYDAALAMANADLKTHGNRPEIVDAKKNVLRLMPHKSSKHSKKKSKSSAN